MNAIYNFLRLMKIMEVENILQFHGEIVFQNLNIRRHKKKTVFFKNIISDLIKIT